jgi:hypothetical protein
MQQRGATSGNDRQSVWICHALWDERIVRPLRVGERCGS